MGPVVLLTVIAIKGRGYMEKWYFNIRPGFPSPPSHSSSQILVAIAIEVPFTLLPSLSLRKIVMNGTSIVRQPVQ